MWIFFGHFFELELADNAPSGCSCSGNAQRSLTCGPIKPLHFAQVVALYCRGLFGTAYEVTAVLERPDEMKIKWKENCRCWHGTAKKSFPRFEAWRSAEYEEDQWCLNMLKSPNAVPISVRCLPSLAAAKEFARGLLAEFVRTPNGALPATVGRNAAQTYAPRPAAMHPQLS